MKLNSTISLIVILVISCPGVSIYASAAGPDFGPNVLIFDSQMPMEEIQQKIDDVYKQMVRSEFSTNRYAFVFKPGQYKLDVRVGYYTQVLGLGQSPDDVVITGAVRLKSRGRGGVLTNFWRGCENIAVYQRCLYRWKLGCPHILFTQKLVHRPGTGSG